MRSKAVLDRDVYGYRAALWVMAAERPIPFPLAYAMHRAQDRSHLLRQRQGPPVREKGESTISGHRHPEAAQCQQASPEMSPPLEQRTLRARQGIRLCPLQMHVARLHGPVQDRSTDIGPDEHKRTTGIVRLDLAVPGIAAGDVS